MSKSVGDPQNFSQGTSVPLNNVREKSGTWLTRVFAKWKRAYTVSCTLVPVSPITVVLLTMSFVLLFGFHRPRGEQHGPHRQGTRREPKLDSQCRNTVPCPAASRILVHFNVVVSKNCVLCLKVSNAILSFTKWRYSNRTSVTIFLVGSAGDNGNYTTRTQLLSQGVTTKQQRQRKIKLYWRLKVFTTFGSRLGRTYGRWSKGSTIVECVGAM